jgi:hypothetical protein
MTFKIIIRLNLIVIHSKSNCDFKNHINIRRIKGLSLTLLFEISCPNFRKFVQKMIKVGAGPGSRQVLVCQAHLCWTLKALAPFSFSTQIS